MNDRTVEIEIGLERLIGAEELSAYKESLKEKWKNGDDFWKAADARAKASLEKLFVSLGERDGKVGIFFSATNDIEADRWVELSEALCDIQDHGEEAIEIIAAALQRAAEALRGA